MREWNQRIKPGTIGYVDQFSTTELITLLLIMMSLSMLDRTSRIQLVVTAGSTNKLGRVYHTLVYDIFFPRPVQRRDEMMCHDQGVNMP